MANILASNQLRKGTVYEDGNDVVVVLDYKHQKYGRGQATIRVKVKSLRTAAIAEKTYDTGAKLTEVETSKRNLQYLYADDVHAFFMDSTTYEQFALLIGEVKDDLVYLKPTEKLIGLFIDSDLVSLEIPKVVELEVTEAADATAGDSATGANKKVIVETGAQVDTPLFVKRGDIIRVNTEMGTYAGRG